MGRHRPAGSVFHVGPTHFTLPLFHNQNSPVLDSKTCVDNSQTQLLNVTYSHHLKTFTGAMKQNLYVIYYLG